jgi:iron complex outermembrane receptor protein
MLRVNWVRDSGRAHSLLAGAAVAAVLSVSGVSGARSADEAPAATGEQTGLQEIVITAQRRTEREQDVPISISTVSGAALEQKGIIDVAELPQAVPSLRIDYAGNTVQPSIRGVGSQVAGPGFVSNVGVYVDGFYIPSPGATDINLIDITSVSVLKGPQGTLFGYNATGGAIQITTPTPEQEESGFARVGYGSHNDANVAFYGTSGINQMLAFNIAGSYDRGDGYVTNIVTDNHKAGEYHTWSVRPKLLFTPTDSMSFLFAYSHAYTDDPWTQNTIARDGQTIGSIIPNNIIATDRSQVSNNAPNYMHLTSDSGTLTSKFKFDFADLTSYTGYRRDYVSQGLEYDDTPANIYAAEWTIPDTTLTQEFDLASKAGGRLQWVLGAFYMDLKDIYLYNTNSADSPSGTGAPFNPLFTSTNDTKSAAAFGDATYEVIDKVFLTAGGRYSHDESCLSFDLFVASLVGSGCHTFTNFSPRAVARYQLDSQSNVYASFTEGYKSGTLPGSSFSFTPVQPEKIGATEVGYKIANSVVQFNTAAFYYNYTDIQITAYGANGVSVTRNAAAAHIYGVDGDLTWDVTTDFALNVSGAYTHARYVDFQNAIGFQQNLVPTSPSYGQFGVFNINADGYHVQRTPDFAGSVGGSYGFNVGGGRLVLNANVFYTSKFYFDSVQQLPQDAYTLLNLRTTWTDRTGRYAVSVFGNNVTDQKYFAQNFTDTFASRAVYGPPALFGGTFTVRF